MGWPTPGGSSALQLDQDQSSALLWQMTLDPLHHAQQDAHRILGTAGVALHSRQKAQRHAAIKSWQMLG